MNIYRLRAKISLDNTVSMPYDSSMTPTTRKQLEFRPSLHGGKWHIRTISGVALCSGLIEVPASESFIVGGSHPICCRRCKTTGEKV